MLEHELHPSASKFISSLVKSLQLLCNGHVEFNESIELIGHINLRVDRVYKYNYIVDEQVSKEGSNSSTFLSNSYHSQPPQSASELPPQADDGTNHSHNSSGQNQSPHGMHTVKVCHTVSADPCQKQDIMVKMEGNDDCMVLPETEENYDHLNMGLQDGDPTPSTSGPPPESYEMSYTDHHDNFSDMSTKKRKVENNNPLATLEDTGLARSNVQDVNDFDVNNIDKDLRENGETRVNVVDKDIDLAKLTKESLAIPQSINCLKENIANIASMLNLQVIPNDTDDINGMNASLCPDAKSIKKEFLEHLDKDKVQKLKRLLKSKNSKRKKQELKAILSETGISEDLLRSLAQDSLHSRHKLTARDDFNRSHKRSMRVRTQERQQKLLEMAENLKRSKGVNGNTIVVSRLGNKKIALHRSSISIFSHQTQFLNLDNIDEAVDALTGRMNKYSRPLDKSRDKKPVSTPKRRKIRHLVGRITKDINDAGYRVIFSHTVGSDIDSGTAELSILPIKADELFPEVKEDPKLEISEEDYAKYLEREHFLEKQKANEEKMKELEVQLTQLLSGGDEVLVPKRKRYGPADAKPTDAERMKMFRKRLKEDPSKYQERKQKRSLTMKNRRLGTLAAKMKGTTAPTITAEDVNEDEHSTTSLTLPQTVAPVNIHCPQVYGHPGNHQSAEQSVSMHHTGQYVGQVPGMQAGHQHPQGLPYTGEMDIVELIAATHNVQNQHFG